MMSFRQMSVSMSEEMVLLRMWGACSSNSFILSGPHRSFGSQTYFLPDSSSTLHRTLHFQKNPSCLTCRRVAGDLRANCPFQLQCRLSWIRNNSLERKTSRGCSVWQIFSEISPASRPTRNLSGTR